MNTIRANNQNHFVQIKGEGLPLIFILGAFIGSGNQEITMLKILQKVSQICGPIILYESQHATPVLVERTTNIDEALKAWRAEYKRRHQEYCQKDKE